MAKKPYEYDIGCVPSNWWYHCIGENILVTLISWFTGIKVKPDQDYLKEEGPIIVVANHQSYLDPMVTSKLTRGRAGNFVTGEFVFRKNPWGHWFRLGGAIPKKQFVVDTIAVKAMMKVMKRKGVLFIYPEATRSVDGSTITFDDGSASTGLTILVPPGGYSPTTGDSSRIGVWAAVMVLAGLGFVGADYARRKFRRPRYVGKH